MKLVSILGGVLCVFLTGCTYSHTITTNISPTTVASKPRDERVSINFTPELQAAFARSKLEASTYTYEFHAGSALRAALSRASEVAYRSVTTGDTRTTNNAFTHQITYGLNYFDINVTQAPGFFTTDVKAVCNVSVTVELFDGEGKLVSRRSASGTGISQHRTSNYSKAREYFAEAAEKAIQQVSDNVANMLMM